MIIRVSKRERFVTVDKTGLEDTRLSFKAKGLLVYLLTKPNDWTVNYRGLAKVGPDKQASILSGLKELEESGYLQRERMHLSSGKWLWEQVLYEVPKGHALETHARSDHALVIHARETHASTEEGQTDKSLEKEDLLLKRLTQTCSGRHIEAEASDVLSLLRRFVDDKLIDEAIGYASQLEQRPRRPRYFLKLMNEWAPQRGVAMPPLTLNVAS